MLIAGQCWGTYLHPAREDWLDKMASIVERLYCQDTIQVIRLVVLGVETATLLGRTVY